MAEYIETQIKDTPEGIRSGLFNWCSVSYDTPDLDYLDESDFGDLVLEDEHHPENMTISCEAYDKHYVFDYRGELSDIGLNIILAYAYTADFQDSQSSTLSETAYIPLSMDAYDYDYNYDDDNDYDNDFGNIADHNTDDEMYNFEDHHSSRSINTTDSYENNDKTSDTRISSHTSSASSSQEHSNPFSTAFTNSNSDAVLSSVAPKSMFHNSVFMRSDELFNKRKPPLLNELALNNEHLVPMSPIVHSEPTGLSTRCPVAPSIQVDNASSQSGPREDSSTRT
ncbi:hypothetical protein PMKS-000296 [Pichia membranifaciens]|uniref:Uncharacterized protein n=1 Tax=Pichia membranifaciens TaxID=4926 RepID=A0A1Q2YBD5_9ASCO|nr:hypothetical protein PMKS-000296 [Pichia membranifaciens]